MLSPPLSPDKQGLPHRLQNDPSCGTQVRVGPGSSVVLEATYDGCYVTEWVSRTRPSGTRDHLLQPGRLTPLGPVPAGILLHHACQSGGDRRCSTRDAHEEKAAQVPCGAPR